MIAQPARVSSNRKLPFYTPSPQVLSSNPDGQADVLQTVTFYMALATAFIKFAMLQEIQTYVMGFKGYLLYIFGVPALLGILLTGGLRRVTVGRTAFYWLAFGVWIVVCIPFSSWRSDSFKVAKNFFFTQVIMLFIIAGLVVSWREFRILVKSIGVAAILNILISRIFGGSAGENRLNLDFGTVANANDYAAHLLLTLPFLEMAGGLLVLWIAFKVLVDASDPPDAAPAPPRFLQAIWFISAADLTM